MLATNKEILEKANAAIVAGMNEEFLTYCAEDTRWTFVGDRTLQGKEAVLNYMTQNYIQPPRFNVTKLVEDGDMLVAVGEILIKDEKGIDAKHQYCDIWRFENGLMAELTAFVIKAKE